MIPFYRLKKFLYLNTYGWIAISSLLICVLSGIILAIPYDIGKPYFSIASILISNPAAAFARNLHFWSAQAFLVFTMLHIYDHLKNSTETNITKKGIWFRLTLSIAFLGYVMISGFILKSDSDSLQARRILSALLESIPWFGRMLRQTFIGPEDNLQLLYVQHIATATIILFIAIYDHVRTIWVNIKTFLVVLLIIGLLSWFFRAPLTSTNDPLMKGPWYFVGLQEILHWISRPWIIMLITFLLLLVLYLLPQLGNYYRKISKMILLVTLLFYLVLTLIGYFFRGPDWKWQWPWENPSGIRSAFILKPISFNSNNIRQLPLVQGKPESCLVCHSGMRGLSISHSQESTGCYSCHLGDPFSLNKKQAHMGMEPVPGNLSNASRTCGSSNCHPQIVGRVKGSLMATLTGMISIDRYVFGESNELDGTATVHELGFSAADRHLRNLCAGCHLGNEKIRNGTSSWLDRGGGCNACHLTYQPEAQKSLEYQRKKSKSDTTLPRIHPSINLAIGNDKCRSCHSRSGRISMSYEGWHETSLTKSNEIDKTRHMTLPDGRVFEFIKSDIHHQKGLSCIDCHSSYELMGDGKSYAHKEEAVDILCSDCHPMGKAEKTLNYANTDRETTLIAWLRNFRTSEVKMAVTERGNQSLVNTFIDDRGQVNLIAKLSGKTYLSKAQTPACAGTKAHERLSCNACHSAWAPQCIGCHNSYEKKTPGFDMLLNKSVKGSWVEYKGKYMADPPVLGVDNNEGSKGIIRTFVPGMILSIDKETFRKGEKKVFHRLYSPVSAHTTQRESRSCKSCHNDPLAIGYGRGRLNYSSSGRWLFEPQFEDNANDGLPEDAWTGFLKERKGIASTRNNYRPFSLKEQKRILTVGACLTCHDPHSAVMQQSLTYFDLLVSNCSKKCIIPIW